MKVQNHSNGALGLPTGQLIPARSTADVPDSDWASAKKHPVVVGWLEDEKLSTGKGKTEAPAPALKAEHAGGGAYFIMDGDKKVGEAMKKEDAEAFNALSDEDKAAFVKKG